MYWMGRLNHAELNASLDELDAFTPSPLPGILFCGALALRP